jgi:hypothetical protein
MSTARLGDSANGLCRRRPTAGEIEITDILPTIERTVYRLTANNAT